mgnify:CR=1 FL=1
MPIWLGSTINSNETANLINQLFNTKAIAMVRRKNGLLYAVLNKAEVGAEPMSAKWNRESKVSGINVQFNLMGGLKSIATVADGYGGGTGETATWGGTVIPSTIFGGVTLPLVHYADAEYFPDSELDRYQGDELRTRDWIGQKMEYLLLSFEDTFGTAINTSTATVPTRTQVVPWRHQISDGVSSGETGFITYGVDRNDSGNADFRGNNTVSTGDLTLAKLFTAKLSCVQRGGMPTVGLAENTLYGKIHRLTEAYTTVNYDEQWTKFGGEYVQYSGTKYILEPRMATQLIGLLDPSTWVLWRRDKNFTRSGIVPDVSRKATHVLVYGYWMGFFCNKPNSNALLTGVTS